MQTIANESSDVSNAVSQADDDASLTACKSKQEWILASAKYTSSGIDHCVVCGNTDPSQVLSAFCSGGSQPACGGVAPPPTTPKAHDCPSGVDALNATIVAATNTTDIDASTVLESLRLCDGPATWKLSADVDQIGTKIGNLGDMNGQPLSTSTALDFLCARYDKSNSTDTCKLR